MGAQHRGGSRVLGRGTEATSSGVFAARHYDVFQRLNAVYRERWARRSDIVGLISGALNDLPRGYFPSTQLRQLQSLHSNMQSRIGLATEEEPASSSYFQDARDDVADLGSKDTISFRHR